MRWYNLTGGGSQTETRQYNALGQMTRLTVPGQLDLEYRFSATANDNKAISQKNYIRGALGHEHWAIAGYPPTCPQIAVNEHT